MNYVDPAELFVSVGAGGFINAIHLVCADDNNWLTIVEGFIKRNFYDEVPSGREANIFLAQLERDLAKDEEWARSNYF